MALKIYTKTGDKGETGLFGGARLPKSDLRIEAYGTIDELNAFLGLARDHTESEGPRRELRAVQDRLFTIGALLAVEPDKPAPLPGLREDDVRMLEQAIDAMNEQLPELKHFILPGGHPAVSYCHVARCVCRRAERRVVALAGEATVDGLLIQYLNRLSDYLFVLARFLGWEMGVEEVYWRGRD
jgi:cob(I)alamin adenosyltransferase